MLQYLLFIILILIENHYLENGSYNACKTELFPSDSTNSLPILSLLHFGCSS